MSTEITVNELNQIWDKWDNYYKPAGVENKAWKHTEKLNGKIADMVFMLDKFDKETASKLGEQVGQVVSRPFLLCYYIGYDLASGQMARANGSNYLAAATAPIDDFVVNILGILVGKGIVSQEKGREMVLEIAKLTGEAANNVCMLGIENFKPVGSKTNLKKPWLAALINCFPLIMGLGYIYLGNWKRFGVVILIQLFSLAPMTWLGLRDLNPVLLAIMWIFTIFDGYSQANAYNKKVSYFA